MVIEGLRCDHESKERAQVSQAGQLYRLFSSKTSLRPRHINSEYRFTIKNSLKSRLIAQSQVIFSSATIITASVLSSDLYFEKNNFFRVR